MTLTLIKPTSTKALLQRKLTRVKKYHEILLYLFKLLFKIWKSSLRVTRTVEGSEVATRDDL